MNEIVTKEIRGIDKDVTYVIRENGMEIDEDEETNQKFESVNGDKVENQRKVVDDGLKDPDIVINLELVPSVINEKGDEVVVFYEELVEEGCEKWHLTICGYFVGWSMNVNELSPWMVNGKPLIVQTWDSDVEIVKTNPFKIPNLVNVPLKALSVTGINTLANRLGRPVVMDQMTANMCKNGTGRLGFARFLVEVEAKKGFFGQNRVRKKSKEEIESKRMSKNANENRGNKDCFMEVRSRKTNENDMGVKNNTTHQNQWNRDGMWNQRNGNYNRGIYVVKQKEASNEDKGNDGKSMDKRIEAQINSNVGIVMNDKPSTLEKVWKVPAETVNEIHKSANKYAFLSKCDEGNNENDTRYDRRNNMTNDDKDDIVGEVDKVTKHLVANEILDYSPTIIRKPYEVIKKHKDFRFSNYVADKLEFNEILEDYWKELHQGCHMFKLVKKLKGMKKPLNKLSYRNGLQQMFNLCAIWGDIFKCRLTAEEDNEMVINVTENQRSCFYIDSNKAPGPDEFTSCFFKKVNATIIALVAKLNTPNKVSDFRPIACCNVIYKCISKILTSRIKDGLKRIVSINQSAFVPVRHIQDNILITQEFLRGYNRVNGAQRCAMKIDIQKEYDTVNWEFLKNVLIQFGFHTIMFQRIMKCVTTSAFSICVNGEVHGYFKGKGS
ncbi:RNA-directed DNA polymerase, eukaryota, reverse transcriptase zinc-binding domain protein [Tanacetum coccineum]|uniref:RNA-directed DNA polymerase, eukaryota, reverse transcriptase zinc-binding domain protein n=1 Tax=Tanacetum coccineum TaxID=301880 RepID=A0ABQ4ZLD5_9ASTR